jgi:hypothetical protein
MSLASKLKESLFTDDTPTQKVTPSVPYVMPAGFTTPVAVPVFTQSATIPLAADPDEVAGLRSKVHPKSGPLVLFQATLASLTEYITDEGQRYHAAQKALAAQNVGVPDVLAELVAVTGRVDGEVQGFETARQQKVAKEVTSRESALADLATQIKSHEDAIQALISQRDTVAAALTVEKSKIAARAEVFTGAAAALKNEYNDAAGKIRRYLGGPQ